MVSPTKNVHYTTLFANYFQTLSYPKKPNRPLSYLKDRFIIL